jgi:hypothetical protein
MDEDETTTEETEREPRKWAWINFWSIMVAGTGAYFGLLNAMIQDVSSLMDEHHDWQVSRRTMMEEGAREIEAMTKAFASESAM